MTAAQKGVLIQAALRGPAKVQFDAVITATMIGPPVDAASITAAITWLRTAYHTADIQQQLKDQLLVTVQEMNQSPQAYYTKIRDIIEMAGYDPAVQNQVEESTFLKGIFLELALAIRSSPIALTLEQKVDYAHRYWTARNPGQQDVYQATLLNHLRKIMYPKQNQSSLSLQKLKRNKFRSMS